jgi:hypothetical protein
VDKSLHGIIAYLPQKHGENFIDEGIVAITAKSVSPPNRRYAIEDAADHGATLGFESNDEPVQWVCWDFHEMRIFPTHYIIKVSSLKSWVVQSSLDGETWTEMDRKMDKMDFKLASYLDPVQ